MTKSKAEQARAKAEAETRRAEREDAALAALPAGYAWHVFGQPDEMWAELRPDEGYRVADAPPRFIPSLETVAALAPLLEPLPLALYRHGCVSIQPIEEKPPQGCDADDAADLAPFLMEAQGAASYQRASVTIRWWARVAGERARISVIIPEPHDGSLGRVDQETAGERTPGKAPGYVTRSDYRMPPGLSGGICVEKADESGHHRALAIVDRITWARNDGGPGRYTVTFHPLGAGGATLLDLVRELRPTPKVEG